MHGKCLTWHLKRLLFFVEMFRSHSKLFYIATICFFIEFLKTNFQLVHLIMLNTLFVVFYQTVLERQITFKDIVAQWWYFDNVLRSYCFIFQSGSNLNSTSRILIWWYFPRLKTAICFMFKERKMSWLAHFKILLSS